MTGQSLNILIAGAGIAGLSTAISLRRAGHRVRILERTDSTAEVGAAITLPPNATRVLLSWGLDVAKARMIPYAGMDLVEGDKDPMKQIDHHVFDDLEGTYGAPYLLSHRIDLHDALTRLAIGEDGPGIPAKIVHSSHILDFDTAGVVHLEDSKEEADLVIAANGVHSRAGQALGYDHPAIPSDTTVIRLLIPSETLLNDPDTAHMLDCGEGMGTTYFSIQEDEQRWLFRYPCRDNQLQNFGLYTSTPSASYALESKKRFSCDRPSLLKALHDFHPSITAVAKHTEEILPLWICTYRQVLPEFFKDRLLVLGDAAHAMQPHVGQGAAQAIEDAAALGVLLDTKRSVTLSENLALFDKVRRDRVTAVQMLSSVPVYKDANDDIAEDFKKALPHIEMPKTKNDTRKYCFSYDIVKDTERVLKEHGSAVNISTNGYTNGQSH